MFQSIVKKCVLTSWSMSIDAEDGTHHKIESIFVEQGEQPAVIATAYLSPDGEVAYQFQSNPMSARVIRAVLSGVEQTVRDLREKSQPF